MQSSFYSRGDARPLLTRMPSRDEALKAQRANLVKFVQQHEQAFAVLPFHPWTIATRKYGVKHKIIPSSLPGCVGLQGVALESAVNPSSGGKKDSELKPLMYYPGLLVTEELFLLFAEAYHCPTALELPAMSDCSVWKKKRLEPQKMLIIGDPTAPGAIINDGKRSGKDGQLARAFASWCSLLSLNSCLCLLAVFSVIFLLACVDLCSKLQAAVCSGQRSACNHDGAQRRQVHGFRRGCHCEGTP